MSVARPRRILIVGPSWVGDMVMSQVLYKLLRSRHEDALIDVLAPPASISLVSRMPEVNRGIRFDMPHGELGIGKRFALGEALKQNQYDQAIVLPNSLKSALVPFAADIPERTGFRGEYRYFLINDMRMMSKRQLPRMIDRFAALGVRIGQAVPELVFPELVVDTEQRDQLRDRFSIDEHQPVLGLCPGAEFGDAKKWPEQHFAALADKAIAAGMQVAIFGGPADTATGDKIIKLMKHPERCKNLAGKTSILEAIDLISACRWVVSNDSGLMHIAAAVGCQTSVVYGSTSPEFTPPLTDKLDIVSLGLQCSPCFKRECPLKHKNCLVQLDADELAPLIARYSGS